MNGLTAATINAGGANIDTGSNDITIAKPLSHAGAGTDGGLNKTGDGTLTLRGDNTYNGVTSVVGGGLVISGSGTTGFGATTVSSGATLGGHGIVRGSLDAQAGSIVRVGTTPEEGVISFNVERYGTIPRTATATAGVVDAPYWNDGWGNYTLADSGYNGATASNLWDDSGVASTIDASFVTYNTWTTETPAIDSDPGVDGDGTHNKRLLYGYMNAGEATWGPPTVVSSVSLAEIPFAAYDVYVYFNSAGGAAGRTGEVSDGTTTYRFTTMPTTSTGANAVFAQTTNTVDYSTSANYAVFSGLSGASQTLTAYFPVNDDWGGIAGFQVVADTSAGLVGETLTVGGDFTLVSSATLEIDLAETVNDLVDVAGAAVLDGLLSVTLDPSYTPALNDAFTVLTASSISGDLSLGGPDGSLFSLAASTATDLILTAISGLEGDYNNDGTVDAADYTVWRDNLNEPAGALFNDSQGVPVGQTQYLAWRGNFGAMLSAPHVDATPLAVPEPSTVFLLLTPAAFAARFRRTCRLRLSTTG